jgi:hypothetical protein
MGWKARFWRRKPLKLAMSRKIVVAAQEFRDVVCLGRRLMKKISYGRLGRGYLAPKGLIWRSFAAVSFRLIPAGATRFVARVVATGACSKRFAGAQLTSWPMLQNPGSAALLGLPAGV